MNQQPAATQSGWLPDAHAHPPVQSFEAGNVHPQPAWAGATGLVAVAKRNAAGLTIWVISCLALGGTYLYRAQPEFVATAQVVLEDRRQPAIGSDAAQLEPTTALDSAQAESEIQVVKSERNLGYVFDTLDLARDPAYAPGPQNLLQRLSGSLFGAGAPAAIPDAQARTLAFQNFSDRVSVRRVGQSYVLEVSFQAPDPAQAARLANSVTSSYVRGQIEFRAAAVQRGTEFLQGRIADIKDELRTATDAVKRGIIPDTQFVYANARVVSAALEPLSKSFPQSKLILLVTGMVALLSGIAVIAARHSADRKVRSRTQLAQMLGLECLSVLPRDRLLDTRRSGSGVSSFSAVLHRPKSDFARGMRVVRAALFAAGAQPRNVVLGVVSCSPREGRSTVAANLAYLVAASGKPTMLIDGDLGQPTLTQALAPDAETGLSDLLSSHTSQERLPDLPIGVDLTFVPATGGRHPTDPNIFIGSPRFQQALLRASAERNVIIDLPPLSVSSDAQAISQLLDGVILIVEANRATLDEVSQAIKTLRLAEARLLAVVLNKVPSGHRRKRPSTRAPGP